jgi:ubiquinone/menaquinone biosynthesis C-methylase UbiE
MVDGGMRTDGSRQAARLQSYYAATAETYDELHGGDEEHQIALWLTAAFVRRLEPASLLDVGCGTGRALSYFRKEFPDLVLRGADPSPDMLRVATERHGIPAEWLDVSGERLPYPDSAFDIAVATGVLHHVAEPVQFIDELLRVARSAVFISDGNKYGNAPVAMSRIKIAARALGVIRQLEWLRHGGKPYTISDSDGLGYPFSVFDHIEQLRGQCQTVLVIPTKGRADMTTRPLMHASHALVCALKSPLRQHVGM